jgi:hypothetical protein
MDIDDPKSQNARITSVLSSLPALTLALPATGKR